MIITFKTNILGASVTGTIDLTIDEVLAIPGLTSSIESSKDNIPMQSNTGCGCNGEHTCGDDCKCSPVVQHTLPNVVNASSDSEDEEEYLSNYNKVILLLQKLHPNDVFTTNYIASSLKMPKSSTYRELIKCVREGKLTVITEGNTNLYRRAKHAI